MVKNKRVLITILLLIGMIPAINPVLLRGQGKKTDEIVVGTMDMVKNLNPYLAQSEIELALQTVVFPPLIADFVEGRRGDQDSFRGVLINSRNITRRTGTDYLEFNISGSPVTPGIFIQNFTRIRSLGPKSNFSWNLKRAESPGQQRVRVYFDRNYTLGKLIASSFPLVNFDAVDGRWDRSDQVFVTNSDRHLLVGFSDYHYNRIDQRRSIIHLSPKTTRTGKNLVVKTLPDYKQLIDRLYAGELQVAFNLSPLTRIQDPNIELADMKFADQYILFIVVTARGMKRGLGDTGIIDHIRGKFKDAFSLDRVLQSSGNIFMRDGFLLETAPFSRSMQPKKLNSPGTVTLLYYRNDINDRLKNMIEGIIGNMGYSFKAVAIDRNTPRHRVYENDFDLVIKSRYVQFPEFLNLRYYKEFLDYYSPLQARGHKRRIDRLLARGGKLSLLHEEAQTLEREMLKQLPIVFLVRYNTRIAVQKGTQNYQSSGVPYFFYNLSQW